MPQHFSVALWPQRNLKMNKSDCIVVIGETMHNVKSFTFLGRGHFSSQKEFS